MKQTILFLTLLFISIISHGQGSSWKTAEKYYNQFKYSAAAEVYEKIIQREPSNMEAIKKLSQCYIKLNNSAEAEVWLAKVCAQPTTTPEFYKFYAQALASNGKYTESDLWYEKYYSVVPDERAKKLSKVGQTISTFYTDSSFYRIKSVAINSTAADFSPAYYKDGFVFCSSRKNKSNATFDWDNSNFIDLYQSLHNKVEVVSLGAPVNSSVHEGPAVFSKGYDTIYFTRNNFTKNHKAASKDDIVKLKIYYSIYSDGVWSKEQSMPINNNEYSVGHPALADNNTLYFVSDMPGGLGGTDLYVTKFNNNVWSTPVNLGPEINTSENEMFPSIDVKGDLYFASSGYSGLGGMDIFCSRLVKGQYKTPVNIGFPINSSKDDFGFITVKNTGYFSSNRGTNPQDDNIYSFIFNHQKLLRVQAVDEMGKPLSNYVVFIAGDSSIIKKDVDSVYTGNFNCQKNYSIQCFKNGYNKNLVSITADRFKEFNAGHTIQITLIKEEKKFMIFLQAPNGSNLPAGTLEIKNTRTGEAKIVHVGTDGSLTVPFTTGQPYAITGNHPSYKSKTIVFDPLDSIANNKIIVTLLPKEVLFEKNELGEIIELVIKYDVNKAIIRKDAALELNKLIAFLKKNPTIKVELGSHSDSRGSNDANLLLSQKRAESAVRYVITKGINSRRLIPIGYGEDDLKIQNATTEQEHQLNRRTTVKITGI